jgi:hypothetical protein
VAASLGVDKSRAQQIVERIRRKGNGNGSS